MRLIGCALALAILTGSAAMAETRVALVIGNGAYRHVPALPNTRNDANDVAASFERLGFAVRRIDDAGFEPMRRGLLEFGKAARGADMAIVFFAGHGMEMGGDNWLVPVDAELKSDLDTEQEAISLRNVVVTVSAASKLGLVVLDACRNNPFMAKMQRSAASRAVGRGLARVEPGGSVLVAFAARDGTVADDGTGRNSPFTTALLRHLETPGLEINFLFRRVRDDVITATGRRQEPFVYGSLSKQEIYLKSPGLAAPAIAPAASPSPAPSPPPARQAPALAAAPHGITLSELEGSDLAIRIKRDMVVRRDGRQASIGVEADFGVRVAAGGAIEQTYVSTADTPFGKRRGEKIVSAFTLDQARPAQEQGGGEAVWTLRNDTLTWVRTLRTGAYRLDVSLVRGANGLTCTARETFTQSGGGGIAMNSSIDGRPMTVIRSRQLSASCRVTRSRAAG